MLLLVLRWVLRWVLFATPYCHHYIALPFCHDVSQTAVPAKGDLVLIHGQVDHLSLKNTSPITRHTFQLHLVEGPSQGVTWSAQNWLQLSDNRPFMPLALSL